jgi:NAD(P)-dependent dehydrogenase (short-subunit alcohol dehydrogenase family)
MELTTPTPSSPSASRSESDYFAGKTIIITGGASGLGASLCHVLSSAGANIVVGDIKLEKAQSVAALLGDCAGKVHAIGFDVGDPVMAQRAVDETMDRYGRLDVLINNAGTDVTLPIQEISFEDWDRVLRTNLYGPFLMSKSALRYMGEGGHIVNITSTAAKRTWPNASAYHASKWGLLGLSHALHAELRSQKIKVTAIVAGGMRTPFLLDRFPDIDLETLQDPINVAKVVKSVLLMPEQTVVPEIMVLPMRETSWP